MMTRRSRASPGAFGKFRGKARPLLDIENLAGLGSGNHILEVGVLIDRAVRIDSLFGFALGAPLLLVLLLLLARLFSAAFFQLVYLGYLLRLACDSGREMTGPVQRRFEEPVHVSDGCPTQ